VDGNSEARERTAGDRGKGYGQGHALRVMAMDGSVDSDSGSGTWHTLCVTTENHKRTKQRSRL
jgi:hypothetical protein